MVGSIYGAGLRASGEFDVVGCLARATSRIRTEQAATRGGRSHEVAIERMAVALHLVSLPTAQDPCICSANPISGETL